jgi:hypothetical protein
MRSDPSIPIAAVDKKIPRRDWILLPLLSLATLILIAGSSELLGWWLFPWSGVHALEHNCLVRDDPTTGVRGAPNTVCWDKIAEAPPIEYKFNSCGHRAGMECVPKSPGAYRIVMVGSSVAMGMRVPQEQSMATYLPVELSRAAGRKVELYNEGLAWGSPHTIDLNFNKILAAQPDLILWVIVPRDLKWVDLLFSQGFGPGAANATHAPVERLGFLANAWKNMRERFAGKPFSEALRDQWDQTRTSFMLRHYLYERQDSYVGAYFRMGDAEAGFLNARFSAAWQDRVKKFNGVATDIEGRAKVADVPLVAVLVPNRAQAAMISMGKWPARYDPYKLDNELKAIITSHGGAYIDILPGFRTVPNPEKYFLPIDGHPTAQGHALVSAFLANELTDGAVPALRTVNQSRASMGRPQ